MVDFKMASHASDQGCQPVKVTVRVRPLNEEEMSVTSANSRSRSGFRKLKSASNVNANQTHAWTSQGDTITQTETRKLVQGKSQFSFDSVFDESANTTHVYDNAVQSVVRGITEGKHGTVFMYGQTSSGKTYTMQGADGANMEKENGVLQLAARDLLRWAEQAEKEVTIRVSYFEIYNETVRDLLGDLADEEETSPRSPSRKQPPLPVLTVREDSVRGGVFLNCEEIDVNDMTTMLGILQHGNSNRSVASTGMNAQSSRSHAIFRISLEIQEEGVKKMATLNLVDLAGSENSFTADTTSQRKREGGKINQSLLSLSQVIHALSLPEEKRPSYINYRDSKLTRILRPHLSGNAQLAVICCVSPSRNCVEETRSTLRFASRAKLVQCKAHVNEVVTQAADPALIKNLQQQLLETKKALDEMAKRNSHAEKASEESSAEVQKLKDMIFGEGDVSEFEVGLRSPTGVVPQSDKNATIRAPKPRKLFSTEPKIPTIYESKKETNSRSMDAETLSRDSAAPMREVLIMNAPAPISTKPRHLQSLDELSQNYASDLENRARFLEDRVEVTEDLVETLKQDLVKARSCVHKLVYNNAKLGGKCTKLTNKVSKLENHGRNEFRQQYMLLKYTMYASLFFFLFGMHEAFLSLAFFLWLSLESYTALEP